MERWHGRIAVVTGASAGIGFSIALKLVANGLKVVGLARRESKLQELADKCKGLSGKFYSYKTDISQKESIQDAFAWITKNVGPLSILVNNAGVFHTVSFQGNEFEKIKNMVDTNLYGVMVVTALALQIMKSNNIDDGHIITIDSIAGHTILELENICCYATTKHGLVAYTKHVRKELAHANSKIRVTSISPGYVLTDMTAQESLSAIFKKLEFPSLMSEDVANAVVFVVACPPQVQISDLTIKATGEKI